MIFKICFDEDEDEEDENLEELLTPWKESDLLVDDWLVQMEKVEIPAN